MQNCKPSFITALCKLCTWLVYECIPLVYFPKKIICPISRNGSIWFYNVYFFGLAFLYLHGIQSCDWCNLEAKTDWMSIMILDVVSKNHFSCRLTCFLVESLQRWCPSNLCSALILNYNFAQCKSCFLTNNPHGNSEQNFSTSTVKTSDRLPRAKAKNYGKPTMSRLMYWLKKNIYFLTFNYPE